MAMKTLKPGGQIIYSTCTFAPEEDEQIIEWLLDNYNLEVVPIKKNIQEWIQDIQNGLLSNMNHYLEL